MNRREFLIAGASLLVPELLLANQDAFWQRDRTLWLRRGGEEFKVTYWSQGAVDIPNYVRLCYLLRDVNDDVTVMMDVNLLNLLYGLQVWDYQLTGIEKPFIATSGQRTVKTNNMTEGAAWDSAHLRGRAVDGRIPGVDHALLAERAKFFKMGGVGKYVTHTHVDTERVRFWNGKTHPNGRI